MEKFVAVLASVYNSKCLKTQAATKQELPKYQAEQNQTYQIVLLKQELNKMLFAKADSLVDKTLPVLLCLYQVLELADYNIDWCGNRSFTVKTLLNNIVAKSQTLQTFTLLYLTLQVYLQHWFRIEM